MVSDSSHVNEGKHLMFLRLVEAAKIVLLV
jgi:hypothetical protein